MIVYDRYDRFYEFKEFKRETLENDQRLMRKADLIINSSQALLEESIKYNKNSILVRNGVELSHFSKVQYFKKKSRKKVLGYVGGIGYWFDFDLIKDLANTYPQYEIHIIGSFRGIKDSKTLNLKHAMNIRFLGEVPYAELPNYVKEFNVGIIPFKINELTKAVDPIKMYEYIAAGKNVVITNLPEARRLKDYIYIAQNKEEFIKFCKEAIENPKANMELLLKVAKENTWEKRVEQIVAAINWILEGN